MVSWLKWWCVGLLALFFSLPALARESSSDWQGYNPAQYLGRSVSYYRDSSGALNLSGALLAYKAGLFEKGTTDILNFGNTSSATWIQVPVEKIQTSTRYLVLGSANIEEVDCYIVEGNKFRHLIAGSLTMPSPGVRSIHEYIFPIESENTEAVWLRVKSRNIILLPLQLVRAEDMHEVENSGKYIMELCFIGFLIALFIFHLFLYFSVKDVAYLYYCLYILALGIYTVGYLGGYAYLLGTSFRTFIYSYPHIFFCVGFASSILITNRFYSIRSLSLLLFRWTGILMAGLCIAMVLSIMGFKAITAACAQFLGLVVPVTLIVTSIYAGRSRQKAVVYLSLAWIVFVLAVVFYVLSLQGILTYRSDSAMILQGGVLLKFVLLSMALGARYQQVLERQRQVEAENYKLVQTHNEVLEQEVTKRTQSLREVIDRLKASDEVKNRLFSIIAHDLRTPFNSLLTILSDDNINLLSEAELKMILRLNSDHFQQLKVMLENILHWARSEMSEVSIRPERFDITRLLQDLIAIYKPVADGKNVSISFNKPAQPLYCTADRNHVQLVLRNLLDNAVKYANNSHKIVLEASSLNGKIWFSIANSLISNGGAHVRQKGIGLGILLCEDYLTRNGSSLLREEDENSIKFSFGLAV